MSLYHDALKTDLYELTMAAGYLQNGVRLRAVFELFCYKSPAQRSYFVTCGLQQAIDYILNLRFSDKDVDFLKSLAVFKSAKNEFFDYLRNFKFSGNVWAMPEGEVFFPKEPVFQVEAPIIESQVLETYVLSTLHIQSLVATKASRVVQAARGRPIIDFGSRRAHGPQAAILAARAAYIAGCLGTSNVAADRRFGVPVYGTMAHSWVGAFDTESEAFLRYHKTFPENTILLVDTYDTIKAVKKAVELKQDLKAVRIDSGNLELLSKAARKILDKAGLKNTKIIASGNLNEHKIQQLLNKKAPIDIFGVGTEMVVSRDLPSLDLVYKLVQIQKEDGTIKAVFKTSPGKKTLAGRKQVYRRYGKNGMILKDIIALFSAKPPAGTRPLLEPVIKNGRLVKPLPSIKTIRARCAKNIRRLPQHCLNLKNGRRLDVEVRINES